MTLRYEILTNIFHYSLNNIFTSFLLTSPAL
nr:MAG TPA: hypothetical protein [Caudoviricetes sp.]